MELETIIDLALALGMGLLVGLQREWTGSHLAGIRTFALITVLGALLTILSTTLGAWLIVAGLVAVAALVVVGVVVGFLSHEEAPGLTTEIAALLMYSVGVALASGQTELGLFVGGVAAVLLHWKGPLHAFVSRIGETDIRAVFQLVLIALVILPILPDKSYGPYAVLNPFEIWLMVVLIVGISLGGYIAYKFLGPRAGTLLGGVLGGLISSTATTVGYSRRSRWAPDTSALAAFVIVVASTIVFGRVLFEVSVVAPEILGAVAAPLLIMMVLLASLAGGLYLVRRGPAESVPVEDDPAQLKSAIAFGLLYAAVLFAVAAVKEHFSDHGLYIVAALSGLTDMDAITLSTAQLIKKGQLPVETGWRMILVGALSNLVFKCGAVALLGHRQLLIRVGSVFGIAFLGGVLLLALWP